MTDTLHTLTIYGASDDLLELEGYITEEYNVYSATTLAFTAPNGARVAIVAEFGGYVAIPNGGWALSVCHLDPRWTYPVRLAERPDDSADPAVILEVPEGTTVREIGR
ncbi:hypothetical protein [Nocardia rhizosphaerae]|uniref:Uncharacterized protein n=1 Tax=Nocardia rhizosphaerae TaxID=1691571 RepID=A0ABV8L2C5_9NOCA